MHLFGLMPQSHFTWADRDLRMVLQCAHCDTGRPFLLMCWSGRSGEVALVSSTLSKTEGPRAADYPAAEDGSKP